MAQKRGNGTYYLSRVSLQGVLKCEGLIPSFKNPGIIKSGAYHWTITDCTFGSVRDQDYVVACLTKYREDGSAEVVDEDARKVAVQLAENLVEAKSWFCYLPGRAAFAHLHVWNKIQRETFGPRMRDVILAPHHGLMRDCSFDAIGDIEGFAQRVVKLQLIEEISARVHPPNPLWGPYWKQLKDYMGNRNATEVSVAEKSSSAVGLTSEVPQVLEQDLTGGADDDSPEPLGSLADQALLMAAAGYGKGKIVGLSGERRVIVRVDETVASFAASKTPEGDELASATHDALDATDKRGNLRH